MGRTLNNLHKSPVKGSFLPQPFKPIHIASSISYKTTPALSTTAACVAGMDRSAGARHPCCPCCCCQCRTFCCNTKTAASASAAALSFTVCAKSDSKPNRIVAASTEAAVCCWTDTSTSAAAAERAAAHAEGACRCTPYAVTAAAVRLLQLLMPSRQTCGGGRRWRPSAAWGSPVPSAGREQKQIRQQIPQET